MKIIHCDEVKYADPKIQDEHFVGKAPVLDDCFRGVHTDRDQHLKVYKPNGEILCVVIRGLMDKKLTANYFNAITKSGAIKKTSNRGMSSGQKPKRRVKEDGTLSNTIGTEEEVESSIIGFFDRYARINYCRKTAWTQEHPEQWLIAEEYTKMVDDLYRQFASVEYEDHKKITDATSPDFKIKDTVFTTITLNRNFRTHYHRDAGNLKEGLAAMSYMKTGKFTGGEVVFPNYGVGVKLYNYDLILFENTEIHGNLEINPISKNYQRVTSVFFYRKNMIYCGTVEDELERAKRNKGDQIIGPITEDLNNGKFKNT